MGLQMLGVRVRPDLKEIIEKAAKAEHRSVSNFIIHATLTYLKEKHGIDYTEEDEN